MRELKKLYINNTGNIADKWEHYLDKYDTLLKNLTTEKISLLEIGILNGGSLDIWAEFFPNFENIIGCDIDEKCKDIKFKNENIKVIIGDIKSTKTKSEITEVSKSYDLIIDDGSHSSEDIISTFFNYFPLVKPGGFYLIEDLHCSYWDESGGGLYSPYSSISFLKKLIDIINQKHWGVEISNNEFLNGILNKYNVSSTQDIKLNIDSIEFIDSVCIIRKLLTKPAFNRIITGEVESVSVDRKTLMNQKYIPPPQKLLLTKSIEEELIDIKNQLLIVNTEFESCKNKLQHVTSTKTWRYTEPFRKVYRKFKELIY